MLFDQERELRVLTTDRKTEGVLPAPSEASQFVGFALFSPDDRLVLAAGTGDNPLQLWKAPQTGVRGYLIRRLALPPGGNAAVRRLRSGQHVCGHWHSGFTRARLGDARQGRDES